MLNCAEEVVVIKIFWITVYFNVVYKENNLLSKTIDRQNVFDY